VFLLSLVEHIKLMSVGVVELCRAYFSWMQEKDTTKGRAKVCLDSAGVSGLPLCMFGAKHNVCWCCRPQPSIFQLNGANVSSLCCFRQA